MDTKKITPDVVKKIELSLEERKQKQDRRKAEAEVPPTVGSDRRTKRDRRTPGE